MAPDKSLNKKLGLTDRTEPGQTGNYLITVICRLQRSLKYHTVATQSIDRQKLAANL